MQSIEGLLAEAGRISATDRTVSARVGSISQAFEVTESYVAYDLERRRLAAACPCEADAFPGGEDALSKSIARIDNARKRLDAAVSVPSNARREYMRASIPESLLRNDPVPRLLFAAAIHDTSAPKRILAGAGGLGGARNSWCAMADCLVAGVKAAPNLAANSSFLESAQKNPEPHFLYPRFGAMPAKWILNAMPTEKGRSSLVDGEGVGSQDPPRRSLRIEGAWDTQVYQWLPAKPGYGYLATAFLRGKSSPGGDATLYLTFLSANGQVIAAATQSLPKGESQIWRVEALCDWAPPLSKWVGIGIGCTRQTEGDWMEGTSVELRGIDAPIAL